MRTHHTRRYKRRVNLSKVSGLLAKFAGFFTRWFLLVRTPFVFPHFKESNNLFFIVVLNNNRQQSTILNNRSAQEEYRLRYRHVPNRAVFCSICQRLKETGSFAKVYERGQNRCPRFTE